MIALVFVLALAPPAALVLWLLARDWFLEWGARDLEVLAAMAGDDLVEEPTYESTLAVTINAARSDVWPWLVQMGYRRGGLYSYDWLDRVFGYLDGPSAEEVLPEFQDLKPGDMIPLGRGPAFPVVKVEPLRALVMGGTAGESRWSWQFELHRHGRERTRLISRNRGTVPRTFGSTALMLFLEPAAFIMTRKMLLGIKRRAEVLAQRRRLSGRAAA